MADIRISALTLRPALLDTDRLEVSADQQTSPDTFATAGAEVQALGAAVRRRLALLVYSTSSAAATADPANAGVMHRFTGTGAKSLTFDNADAWTDELVVHVSNDAASGNLTLVGSGFTLSPPKSGTLVLAPGDAVTVHIIQAASPSLARVYGSTVAA